MWREIAPFIHEQLGRPQRVLDPAAGRGEFINAVPAPERWAIDQVAYAEGTYEPGVHSVVSDIFEAELPAAHFDGIFVSNFLEHLTTQEAVATFLERIHAATAPGGRIAIMGPNFRYCSREYFDMADHTLIFTHRAIAEHLYAAGFEPERVEPRFSALLVHRAASALAAADPHATCGPRWPGGSPASSSWSSAAAAEDRPRSQSAPAASPRCPQIQPWMSARISPGPAPRTPVRRCEQPRAVRDVDRHVPGAIGGIAADVSRWPVISAQSAVVSRSDRLHSRPPPDVQHDAVPPGGSPQLNVDQLHQILDVQQVADLLAAAAEADVAAAGARSGARASSR